MRMSAFHPLQTSSRTRSPRGAAQRQFRTFAGQRFDPLPSRQITLRRGKSLVREQNKSKLSVLAPP